MNLKQEMKGMFTEILGPSVAAQLENFDNPEQYPEDFCKDCRHFLSQLIGESAARERIEPICEKYIKKK